MKKHLSRKDILLNKLRKIGNLSIANCSHVDNKISDNARNINCLARECFELINKDNN